MPEPPPAPPEAPEPAQRAPVPPPPLAPGPGPRRPWRPSPALAVTLAVAVIASLVLGGGLAVRLLQRADDVQRLEELAERQREQIESLRSLLRPNEAAGPFEQVAEVVERIRGLEFRREVRPELVSEAELGRRIAADFTDENPRREVEALDKGLTALGLLAPDDDLYELYLSVLRESAAGYYDDTSKRIVVRAEDASNPTPLVRWLLAHEYVHALTDQRFGLGRLDELFDEGRDDEAAAYLALIEGDATVVMSLYEMEVLTPEERGLLNEARLRASSERLEAAPQALQQYLLFPYVEGAAFVTALFERGRGFALVDRAYRDPPASTEQILHPARYLDRRDDPARVRLPDVAGALGDGWRALDEGGVGEFDVLVLLDQFLQRSDAEDGAEGWDGGRLAVVESDAGILVAVLTEWDSEREAREANEMFGRWLPLRFGNRGGDLPLEGGIGRGWRSADGAGAALRDGTRSLLVVGPDADSVERARRAFGGF